MDYYTKQKSACELICSFVTQTALMKLDFPEKQSDQPDPLSTR